MCLTYIWLLVVVVFFIVVVVVVVVVKFSFLDVVASFFLRFFLKIFTKTFSYSSSSNALNFSVTDIQFSPRHLGLKLATCSADGFVRIYEAIDVINLAHW